jgi:hypothetical protein
MARKPGPKKRRVLQAGEEEILASGDQDGVRWAHYRKQVRGTIGDTYGYRLEYGRHTKETMTRGLPAEQVAAEFKAHVDGIPARIAAAEAQQAADLVQLAHQEFERDRYRRSINPLGYHGAMDAWERAHGRKLPTDLLRRWAHEGVSEAEHHSTWYQAGIARARELGTLSRG